jgi:hypothetical protein
MLLLNTIMIVMFEASPVVAQVCSEAFLRSGKECNWALLSLYVGMGAVVPISHFSTGPQPFGGEGVPTFVTKAACEIAMKKIIAAYSGKSHAEGNFNLYQCSNIKAWTQGQ